MCTNSRSRLARCRRIVRLVVPVGDAVYIRHTDRGRVGGRIVTVGENAERDSATRKDINNQENEPIGGVCALGFSRLPHTQSRRYEDTGARSVCDTCQDIDCAKANCVTVVYAKRTVTRTTSVHPTCPPLSRRYRLASQQCDRTWLMRYTPVRAFGQTRLDSKGKVYRKFAARKKYMREVFRLDLGIRVEGCKARKLRSFHASEGFGSQCFGPEVYERKVCSSKNSDLFLHHF